MSMVARGMFANFSTGYNIVNPNLITFEEQLNSEDIMRIRKYIMNWNFYDGFHWEQIEASDKPEVTQNWCRRFVNKFVSAEFHGGVSCKFDNSVEDVTLEFLDDVWDDNDLEVLFEELGQQKGVTGDSYIHVHYEPKFFPDGTRNPDFEDPFDIYEKGRIRLFLVPSSICFPTFKDGYDTNAMESCTIMFPVHESPNVFGGSNANRYTIMKYVYTADFIQIFKGKELIKNIPNPYGIIPIVHFKNLPLAGRHFGLSDLDDIIPLNTELNLKSADVSEILDYHSAPVTAIFGARIGQLEKGANKVWGGLPKDAKIQNIELNGDLGAASDYKNDVKTAMHEIGGIPKFALGGTDLASNLSGIALQIAFLPLLEVVESKRKMTAKAFQLMNKIILKIGITEKMISIPAGVKPMKFYQHEVIFGDVLPKDMVQELEQLQQEFKLGLVTREDALKRLAKENIKETISDIDKERKDFPMIFGANPMVVASGQKLVSPETGKVICDNPAPIAPAPTGGDNNGDTNKNKPVGTNKDGQTAKINSGLTNKNPNTPQK